MGTFFGFKKSQPIPVVISATRSVAQLRQASSEKTLSVFPISDDAWLWNRILAVFIR